MKKAHKKFKVKTMRRSSRIYLPWLNVGKVETLITFLNSWHDWVQYFIDLFRQRRDASADLADIETVHLGCNRFGISTRIGQAVAKQAKETIRANPDSRKPRLRKHTATLCSHFVTIEPYETSGC